MEEKNITYPEYDYWNFDTVLSILRGNDITDTTLCNVIKKWLIEEVITSSEKINTYTLNCEWGDANFATVHYKKIVKIIATLERVCDIKIRKEDLK